MTYEEFNEAFPTEPLLGSVVVMYHPDANSFYVVKKTFNGPDGWRWVNSNLHDGWGGVTNELITPDMQLVDVFTPLP